MEGSSDTSRTDTDRRHKGHHRNHHPSAASGRGGHRSVPPPPAHHRSFTALPPASPAESLSYGSPGGAFYLGGSPYSTSLRDQGMAMPAPAAAYSAGFGWAGSDSSQQLYRNSSLGSKDKDKKRVCSVLLIATSTLVVMAVLAIAATAAYLGVMTNHSDGDKYEIQFDSSLRVIEGDQFNPALNDRLSPLFQKKSELYRRWIDAVYKKSPLSDSFRRSSVERFDNGSLIVHFRLFFDRRKIPS